MADDEQFDFDELQEWQVEVELKIKNLNRQSLIGAGMGGIALLGVAATNFFLSKMANVLQQLAQSNNALVVHTGMVQDPSVTHVPPNTNGTSPSTIDESKTIPYDADIAEPHLAPETRLSDEKRALIEEDVLRPEDIKREAFE